MRQNCIKYLLVFHVALLMGLFWQNETIARILDVVASSGETVDLSLLEERDCNCTTPLYLNELVTEADLVFKGVVEDIQYGDCLTETPGRASVTLTYVTYKVSKIIHGELKEENITLRIFGGFEDNEDMAYGELSGTPRFDLGDEDILFVQGNTRKLIPLVKDSKGRLRVVKNQVYTENGKAVLLDESGQLVIGHAINLDEVLETTVIGKDGQIKMRLRKKHNPKAKDVTEGSEAVTPNRVIEKIIALNIPHDPEKIFINADSNSNDNCPDLSPETYSDTDNPVEDPIDAEEKEDQEDKINE